MENSHHHYFSLDSFEQSTELVAIYDPVFVVTSVLIAVIASLISFSLSARTAKSDFKNERAIWSVAAACFLGFGIWAMHFVGMIAYTLPIEVSYDPLITLVSIIPAIFASLIVVAYHPEKSRNLWLSSLLMGVGIGSMHYVGMMALKMNAAMVYNGWLFSLSVIVAVVLSGISLKAHELVMRRKRKISRQILPAFIMGSAISGMHYTGMLSMHVFPLATTVLSEEQHHKELAYLVMFMVAFFSIIFILLLELRVRTLSADRFTAVLSTVQEGVITFDRDGKLEFVNPAALAMFDYQIREMKFKRVTDLVNAASGSNVTLLNEVAKVSGSHIVKNIPQRIEGIRKNGSVFPMSLLVNKLPGNHQAFVCTVKDLSDIKNQEVFAQTVFDTLPDMLFVKSAEDLTFTHVNDQVSRVFGKAKSEMVGLTDFDIFKRDEAEKVLESDMRILNKEIKESCEEHPYTINGVERFLETKKVVIHDANNKPQYILSLTEDITELRKTQKKLEALNKRMSLAADVAHIGVWEWNLENNELIWDDWMHRIYSVPKHEFEDYYTVWSNMVYADDVEELKAQIDEAINAESEFHAQFRIQVDKGRIRYIRADGLVEGNKMFGINIDITEQVLAEKKINELANQDSLTGLANRNLLSTFIELEFARIERTQLKCFCLYFDLNKFKPINDNYGHNIGDEILIEVANRLKRLCRSSDLAARMGGDEFVLIVTDVESVFEIKELINRVQCSIEKPIETTKGVMSVGASIGYSCYPDEASNLDELIHTADERMYQVKSTRNKA
ncbi:hypothetical protein KUL42_11670 [Alteromonas sp. KUL42]|uniref:sensor domain-containing diguanylate cyclase n=1 Tax=Alteromonas sp. KUL42 TaxID=2480797 RepID=UPI00079AB713|nr:diguanylate cyclase [Alteromonas sp. KUL42]KXJ59240.1 MAG: diguanylate cyclase [Alteromonas sp. Nap_26]TAP37010.1 diguanylate cyclase [Alteromonas sp. KUL42]GEA06406.1 hypothetical protein KUL42_11670 [Alteromonas sp. KUL42]